MFNRILLLLLLFVSFSFSSEIVQIHINKLHGLMSFTESISSSKYSLKSLENIYRAKHKGNIESKKYLLKYKELHKNIKKARIYSYAKSINLYKMIKIESTFAKDIDDLQNMVLRYKTAIKKDKIKEYFKTLKYFLSIYEKLIWDVNYSKLNAKAEDIRELMIQSKYDELIKKAAIFYGVKDNEIQKIHLALYPIPSGDNTLAFMLGDVESIGVLVHKKKSNIKWLLSATIFHEIAHIFYVKNQKNIESYFSLFGTKISKKIKKTFNESVATAIGAGWAFFQITNGLQSNGKWYNNKVYDKQAKAIYPLIDRYITQSKMIDKKFVKNYIDAME